MYYTYKLLNHSIPWRMTLSSSGAFQELIWTDIAQVWSLYVTHRIDNCEAYALCGSHGSCNADNSPICECLDGFEPKIHQEWDRANWSHGCVREASLNCSEDVFVKYSGVKLPDTQRSWYTTRMGLEGCEAKCKRNCTCTAYASLDIQEGGDGCLLWFGDLIDIREYDKNGQDLYIRMAASEADMLESQPNPKKPNRKRLRVITVSSMVVGVLILGIGLIVYTLLKKGLCGRGKTN